MRASKTQALVFEALDNCLTNGYDSCKTDAPRQVAIELCDGVADLEGRDPDKLVPHVEAWRAKQR